MPIRIHPSAVICFRLGGQWQLPRESARGTLVSFRRAGSSEVRKKLSYYSEVDYFQEEREFQFDSLESSLESTTVDCIYLGMSNGRNIKSSSTRNLKLGLDWEDTSRVIGWYRQELGVGFRLLNERRDQKRLYSGQ